MVMLNLGVKEAKVPYGFRGNGENKVIYALRVVIVYNTIMLLFNTSG